jgi:hypothetical protein
MPILGGVVLLIQLCFPYWLDLARRTMQVTS